MSADSQTPISLSALVCGLLMIYHRIQSPNMIITHQAGALSAAADSSQHLTPLSADSGDSWLRMTAACVLVRDASIFVLALCNTAANQGAVTIIGGGPLKSQCTLAPSHSGLYTGTRTSSAVSGCTPHYLHTVTSVTAGTRGRYKAAPVFWWLCTLQRNVIRKAITTHLYI